MTERLRPSYTFTEDKLAELRAIAPEAFEDGKLDWDTLRECLGDFLTDSEAAEEHFGLNWHGKRAARRLAAQPSKGTLLPAPGEGVNEETTGNLFLEGDNLEILKLLQKSYAGRVKMIYIDPPYNTGNDFVYRDDYSEPLESYLKRSGQQGERGELLTSNPKSSGRFHTEWLNMIYPRLRVARTLLRDDGVIFVSIDDNEVHNLRAVMNEIFGEENFICEFVWRRHGGGGNDSKFVASEHEYILCASKVRDQISQKLRLPLTEAEKAEYTGRDKHFDTLGPYKTKSLKSARPDSPRPNLRYVIELPNGIQLHEDWRWEKEKLLFSLSEDKVIIRKDRNDNWQIDYKIYLYENEDDEERTKVPRSLLIDVERNSEGRKQLRDLLGIDGIFSNPKPAGLLNYFLNITTKEDDIILDFFSGSGTTAQAVMELNREDGGNRQFILTQIPEPPASGSAAEKTGYATIAEIGKERVRRVIAKMKTGQQTLETRETPEDLGFRVLKLAPSHFKAWQEYKGDDLDTLQGLFDAQETPLVEGWTREGLTSEILLMEGFPLDSRVSPLPEFSENLVTRITTPALGYALLLCLDEKVQRGTLDALTLPPGDRFLCLDSAISDDAKIHLTQLGTLKTL